jgi:hypothetical protein
MQPSAKTNREPKTAKTTKLNGHPAPTRDRTPSRDASGHVNKHRPKQHQQQHSQIGAKIQNTLTTLTSFKNLSLYPAIRTFKFPALAQTQQTSQQQQQQAQISLHHTARHQHGTTTNRSQPQSILHVTKPVQIRTPRAPLDKQSQLASFGVL